MIDPSNILSWIFTLTGPEDTLTISSAGGLGDGGTGNLVFTEGTYAATPRTLTLGAGYRFREIDAIFDENGFDIENISSQIA